MASKSEVIGSALGPYIVSATLQRVDENAAIQITFEKLKYSEPILFSNLRIEIYDINGQIVPADRSGKSESLVEIKDALGNSAIAHFVLKKTKGIAVGHILIQYDQWQTIVPLQY